MVPRTPNRSPHTRLVLEEFLGDPTAWRHGYDLAKQTELQSGTLYPILIRLAEQGLLEEDCRPSEVPGRPHRHVYRLSSAGIAAARELTRRQRRNRAPLRLSKAPLR